MPRLLTQPNKKAYRLTQITCYEKKQGNEEDKTLVNTLLQECHL